MNLVLLLLLSGIFLLVAYYTYGKYVVKKLKIDNRNNTPAHHLKDGVDYVPTKKFIVLGHHFASIAGAGPIIGPIIAVTFGWIPAVIWILLGGVFFGAVHDTTSMVASLRHRGKSIGTIIQSYIGYGGKRLFLIFSFATLILIIAVFADIIAKTFVKNPEVASASGLFIVLAIAFGQFNRHFEKQGKKNAFLILSIVGVTLMYVFIFLGTEIPVELSYAAWVALLLAYSYFASVTPMPFLLQPRDYLSSFLLYGLMILAVVGVLVANPEIQMDNKVVFESENMGYLFPVLFVTVACGAISGFHSLVASGTTSKQIDKEGDVKMVGFGGMLIESFLAIISVGAVIVLERTDYTLLLFSEGPVNMFADGLGFIISSLGISEKLAVTFVALTISAFALTTLDTCTRLARFTFQEYFEEVKQPAIHKMSQNRFLATAVVILFSVLMLLSGEFSLLWPIFGSANQLLAALALLAVTVWLYKIKENATFVLVPMFFMFAVTLSSLFLFALANYQKGIYVLAFIAGLLFLLSIILIRLAFNSLKNKDKVAGSDY